MSSRWRMTSCHGQAVSIDHSDSSVKLMGFGTHLLALVFYIACEKRLMMPAVRIAPRRNTFVGDLLRRVILLGATLPVTTLGTCLNGSNDSITPSSTRLSSIEARMSDLSTMSIVIHWSTQHLSAKCSDLIESATSKVSMLLHA
jgi:hypothetical protein